MTLEQAYKVLQLNYQEAVSMPNVVRNPVAWALYRTWREADAAVEKTSQKGRGDKHDGK